MKVIHSAKSVCGRRIAYYKHHSIPTVCLNRMPVRKVLQNHKCPEAVCCSKNLIFNKNVGIIFIYLASLLIWPLFTFHFIALNFDETLQL